MAKLPNISLAFMNRLTISQKLIFGFVLIIGTYLSSNIQTYISLGNMNEYVQNAIEDETLKQNFLQYQIDHLNWVAKLSRLITDHSFHSTDIQLDHTKCRFGKFLYGENRKQLELLAPELKNTLKEVEESHKHSHEIGRQIVENYIPVDPEAVNKVDLLLNNYLQWESLIRTAIKAKLTYLNFSTKPKESILLTWLNTEALKTEFIAGSTELVQVVNNLKAANDKLYSSADKIAQFMKDYDFVSAENELNKNILVQLSIALGGLDSIRSEGVKRVASLNKAENLYEHKILPNLDTITSHLKVIIDDLSKISEKAVEEEEALIHRSENLSIAVSLGALVLALIVAFTILKAIKRPIQNMVTALKTIADGDLTNRLEITSHDEISAMGTALNSTSNSMQNAMRSIGQNATTLASASEELSAISVQMSDNASETSKQAATASEAASSVKSNINAVAAAAEEMSATVSEIAQNASSAASAADEGVNAAEATTLVISRLGDSSDKIGNVVNLISSIAEQTNLLALNATIEAARAGEAGKGFAVVANEVKDLAKETSDATEEISKNIESIQSDTQSVVLSIQQFNEIINKVSQISNTIASAVEEQSATTNEIARTAARAAEGAGAITDNINTVSETASSTTMGASETMRAVEELSKMASELNSLVTQFKY